VTVALNYELTGPATGEVVLFSNAIGTDLRMWDDQADPLAAAGFRVLRYDQRGHGGSPAPAGPYSLDDLAGDVLALLDTLGVTRVSFVGLSLGGMVGMWLAQHAPERLNRLVLCCTSAELGPPQRWADRAAAVRESGLDGMTDAQLDRWVTADFQQTQQDRTAWLREMFLATPPEGYASCCSAIETMAIAEGLEAITTPTLVIAGSVDQATPVEHALRITAEVPHSRLEIVDGAAHLGNVERPVEFTNLILSHLMQDRFATGMATRRAVLGDEHVDDAVATTTDFTRPFQDYVTESAWGAVWSRPGLDRRSRSIATLAALTALRAHDELPMHVRAAVHNGLTRAEIAEVLLHTTVYAGAPAGNTAFQIAERTLDEVAAADGETH
jgi:3-oxoadipate enol-lactonase / 4-carboxymuconolactone decarboxylase